MKNIIILFHCKSYQLQIWFVLVPRQCPESAFRSPVPNRRSRLRRSNRVPRRQRRLSNHLPENCNVISAIELSRRPPTWKATFSRIQIQSPTNAKYADGVNFLHHSFFLSFSVLFCLFSFFSFFSLFFCSFLSLFFSLFYSFLNLFFHKST